MLHIVGVWQFCLLLIDCELLVAWMMSGPRMMTDDTETEKGTERHTETDRQSHNTRESANQSKGHAHRLASREAFKVWPEMLLSMNGL